MKIYFPCKHDEEPDVLWSDDCVLDNRSEPVVRRGGEPFKNCYDIEEGAHRSHIVDPSRSLAKPIIDLLNGCIKEPHWDECDCLSVLIADMDIKREHPLREDVVAFWTIFPDGVAEALSNCYMKDCCYNNKHPAIVRVLNNPFFYKSPNSNERRLAEIAEDSGLRFALDRIAAIPDPNTLAHEIALLNHGVRKSPSIVQSVREILSASIAETMSNLGLMPLVPSCEAPTTGKGASQ